MATWIYEARTGEGRVVRGTREADDRRSALEALRAEGLFLMRLEARPARAPKKAPVPLRPHRAAPPAEANGAGEIGQLQRPPVAATVTATAPVMGAAVTNTGSPATPARPDPLRAPAAPQVLRPPGQAAPVPLVRQPYLRANDQDLSNFFRQLAALIHAGTGIGSALKTLAEHGGGNALRKAAGQMAERAMTGESFSDSMKAYPGLFTPLMIGIMSAGERGGFMETSLNRLADYSERDYQLQQSIKRETWYPKCVIFFAFFIGGVPTLVLQGVPPFLRQVLPPYLIIALLWIGWKIWKLVKPALITGAIEPIKFGNTSPAKIYDEIKLVLPIIGKTARALASAKFCRALGALYSAGVAPDAAVRLGAQACGNRVVADRALKTIPALQAGRPLTDCMKETRVFNPLALQMMRVGEESGDLDGQLDKAADFLETNAETTIKQAVPVIGILALCGVGVYVLITAVQFYTGYFDNMFTQAGG